MLLFQRTLSSHNVLVGYSDQKHHSSCLLQLAFLWFWDGSVCNCPQLSKSSESYSTSAWTQLCPSSMNTSACVMCLLLSGDQHRNWPDVGSVMSVLTSGHPLSWPLTSAGLDTKESPLGVMKQRTSDSDEKLSISQIWSLPPSPLFLWNCCLPRQTYGLD